MPGETLVQPDFSPYPVSHQVACWCCCSPIFPQHNSPPTPHPITDATMIFSLETTILLAELGLLSVALFSVCMLDQNQICNQFMALCSICIMM